MPICSPLSGVSLEQLTPRIVNPYHPPPAGSDDPHHAVELAELQPGTTIAISGLPVQAILDGTVVGVSRERFPYGNAVIIESEIGNWTDSAVPLPTPAPTLAVIPVLTCPALPASFIIPSQERSLFILYAHLEQPSTLQNGETVNCGDPIGAIGASGNALNPHVHIEARLGPAGVRFPSLAHYDASATEEEMAFYCLWRVSGLFQHIDPTALFAGTLTSPQQ